jgi:2-deoxy-D-gluconate 3-dehydrogenase
MTNKAIQTDLVSQGGLPSLASHRINISGIAPGFFTINVGGGCSRALTNEVTRQVIAEIERRTPIGNIGDVEDLEGTAVYLASEASNYLTGHSVAVVGGWLSW